MAMDGQGAGRVFHTSGDGKRRPVRIVGGGLKSLVIGGVECAPSLHNHATCGRAEAPPERGGLNRQTE